MQSSPARTGPQRSWRHHRIARYPFETGINPYQSLFYRALGELGIELAEDSPFTATALVRGRARASVLHFHWRLDRLYGSRATPMRVAVARARLRLARRLGYTIMWTIHELASRERPGAREPMADALARAADVLLCHDPDLADRAAAELGIDRSRIDVVPHGPLATAYPAPRSTREETRAQLGLAAGDVALLTFGAMKAYKEIDLVLAAFTQVTVPGARLVVAGQPIDPGLRELLTAAAAADRRIVLVDRFVPGHEVRELFAACDLAVLGRRDGWTSGALVLALSLGLPAVVADRPAYRRLIGHGRAGWAFAPEGGADALAAALSEALDAPVRVRAAAGAAAVAITAALTWEEAAWRVAQRLAPGAAPSRRPVHLAPAPREPGSLSPVAADA